MRFSTAAIFSALAALVSAHSQPDYNQAPTGNPIYTPGLNQVVEAGQTFTITWDPTTTGPVSLVLMRGPSTNVVPIGTIAEQVPNTGRFDWVPSTSLEPDVTHYGLLLIVEGTGQYQYSTQFGVSNPHYGSSSSSTTKAAPTLVPTDASAASATTDDATSTRYVSVTTTICPKGTAKSSSTPLIGSSRHASTPVVSPSKTAVQPTLQPTLQPQPSGPSGNPSTTGPATPLHTGAAGRNMISFGAVAAGMLAMLAF
ncbi:hypothetical protein EYZ11_011413 [Aspergillus tanneri]|uniref:Yeast cell wall synthesis Kre9/Knh1-like N-terminal domain-containing protein n=1 Tax=Aspergillus tanneri TaxID=1220188 RepID=A0A4S3J2T6_9EURO|nr:uncharacterized protein ATNIH1004_004482 [Aspergillus tanneri]KAA8648597.1 hypothetical protein ATNIH1004_004482 [Aspergillus tanneri]THC89133.1 hypothetical protein EYZ11_011413 [Aspergillus tanneri]